MPIITPFRPKGTLGLLGAQVSGYLTVGGQTEREEQIPQGLTVWGFRAVFRANPLSEKVSHSVSRYLPVRRRV